MLCMHCGHEMSRCRRGPFLKLFSRACYRCDDCGFRTNFYRPIVTAFQRSAACPLCCNRNLAVHRSVDPVERVSRNLLRRLLFGFPLYYCPFCRYQFRDWRRRDPRTYPEGGDGSEKPGSGPTTGPSSSGVPAPAGAESPPGPLRSSRIVRVAGGTPPALLRSQYSKAPRRPLLVE